MSYWPESDVIDRASRVLGTVVATGASAADLALDATALAGNVLLTAIRDRLPSTIGQKTSANSLAVVVASDQSALSPERATSGAPVGVTVSTTAVQVLALNAAAKSRIITNNGVRSIFLGTSSSVTSSGANMGVQVSSGGVYSDTGDGLYTGAIYAIGEIASASENVSAWERS